MMQFSQGVQDQPVAVMILIALTITNKEGRVLRTRGHAKIMSRTSSTITTTEKEDQKQKNDQCACSVGILLGYGSSQWRL